MNALALELASREKISPDSKSEGFKLKVSNALWGQNGLPFQAAFLDTLAENYGAGMRLLDFKNAPEPARLTINQWVSDQTQEKIKDLLPNGSISSLTRLVLTNAIYFKAGWQQPFNPAQTQPGNFYPTPDAPVSAQMMNNSLELRYGEGRGWQAASLPYVGKQLSMLILLPEAGQMDSFERNLSAQQLTTILDGLEMAQVNLSLPKFRIESSFSLSGALQSLGMTGAFDPAKADFSGMTGSRDLFISSVVHKAFVNVDEEGTEAAAATAVIMETTAMPTKTVDLKVDRPFLFLIIDQGTGSVLFIGRVNNPVG